MGRICGRKNYLTGGTVLNNKQGKLLRIYISEHLHREGRPLYEWLILKAREMHMSGATVLRGIEGYGASSCIHTASLVELSGNLPVVVELVDSAEKIESYLSQTDTAITSGLATVEDVEVRVYRSDAG